MINLGSILKASDKEIEAFCQQKDLYPEQISTESVYVNRRQIALNDADMLAKIGFSASEILNKLSALLAKANIHVDQQTIEFEGNHYTLANFTRRAKMIDLCVFCDHKTPAPKHFTLQNVSTSKSIAIFESTLHDIEKHEYFGRPHTQYRIDPASICEVLQLVR